MPVSSIIFSLEFLKRDELDAEASFKNDVDGEIADAKEDMWLVFFSGLITTVELFLKRDGGLVVNTWIEGFTFSTRCNYRLL